MGNREIQCFGDLRMEFGAGEGVAGGDVGEADQSLHEGKLARMVDLQTGDSLPIR
jgi:hypothetical protein